MMINPASFTIYVTINFYVDTQVFAVAFERRNTGEST